MLLGVLLRLVLLGLTAEAIGPVVSNNEWTPVVNSQRVYLSEETLAKYRQQESAQQRYDVIDTGNNNQLEYIDNNGEGVTEEVIYIPEEDFEPQKILDEQDEPDSKEEKPIIVYPEGTIQGNAGYQERPAPIYANQPGPPERPTFSAPRPIRPPGPPPNYRRPVRPPPPNRRPQFPPAASRNAPLPYPQPSPEEAGPRSPPQGPPPPGPPQGLPPPRRPGPPPRRPPPPPPPTQAGGVLSSVQQFVSGVKCTALGVAGDVRLQDENFVRQQLDCVLDEGPCDELGTTIKRMAPEILRGLCPPPCDQCKKAQIQKIMSTIARKYPIEWNKMVQRVG